MGWFTSHIVNPIAGQIDAVVDIVEDGFGAIERELNDPTNQQILAAAGGFLVGGPGGAIAAQQTVASVQAAHEAERVAAAQQRQREVQQRQANVAAIRQRAAALRERRLAESQILATTSAAGAASSSAAAGAGAGVINQTASNFNIITQNQSAQNEMFRLAGQIGASETNINRIGSTAAIGRSVFEAFPSIQAYIKSK